jgi:FkbM family methyltransferase
LVARAENPEARVLAFEPMPDVLERCLANLRINEVSDIEVYAAAASSSTGTQPFWYVPGVTAPSSSGLNRDFFTTNVTHLMVATVRLSDILEGLKLELAENDLVKIDVEGHEPDVLRGLSDHLGGRPTLLVEILARGTTAPAIEELVRGLGYSYFELRPNGPHRVSQLGANPDIRNYLLSVLPETELRDAWAAAIGRT